MRLTYFLLGIFTLLVNLAKSQSSNQSKSPATEISNNLGQDHFESVVLVPHNSKLYVIRGTKNLVDKILLTFAFVPVK